MLMEEFYFDKATVLFFYKNNAGYYEKHSSISLNWNEEIVKKYNEYYCRLDDTLPVLDQTTPVIFRSSTFFNQNNRENTQYYKEYLLPNNCIYSIDANLSLQNDGDLKGGYCFYRGKEKSDFTEHEMRLAKLFQPHLSNVLKTYGHKPAETSMPYLLEDYNYVGTAILNEDYEIIRSNTTFKKLLTPINDDNRRYNEVFKKAVLLCQSLKNDKNALNRLSAEHKIDNEPIFLEVSRIHMQDHPDKVEFCCLIYDLSHFFIHTLDQAKDKYQLTAREMDILKAVIKGQSNEEISKLLFISLPTTKKHLAAIYGKMDIKSHKQIFEKLKFL
jgi:DNA-binding CsgD family transcriptional regulator